MTLQQKLDELTQQFGDKIPDEAKAIMKEVNNALKAELSERKLPKVGDKLPAFSLQNQNGETVTLESLLQDGPLIVSFFRGVWCPYCNIEVKALESYVQEFNNAGANIVVISPQVQKSAKKSVEVNETSFDVLSDLGNAYANELDIAFTLPEALKNLYKGFGISLPDYNGNESWSLPMPARIVVAQDGTIIAIDVNPDYTQRPDPGETLTVLKQQKVA